MILEFKFINDDFFQYKLYMYTKSKRATKNRMLGRVIVPLIYVGIAIYEIIKIKPNITIAVIFSLIAVIWFILYPIYSKYRINKHFKNDLKEYYKNKVDKKVEVEFNPDFIQTKDFTGESKINNSQLKELIELKNHFFIKLVTEDALVIPKRAISDINAFRHNISELNIQHIDDTNWSW